jgi:hypothetical protein
VDNTVIYAGTAQRENVADYISPGKDRNHWRDVVNMKLKFPVSKTVDSFLTK